MHPGSALNARSGPRQGIALVAALAAMAGAVPLPASGQGGPPTPASRPALTIELPADSLLHRRPPLVRATGMLSREKLQKLLVAGFPARFHFRVELWSEGRFWLDHLQDSREYDVFVRWLPVEKKYEVIQVEDDLPLSLGKHATITDAEGAVGRANAPAITALRLRETQYYQVSLLVEALSERDLDEIERWLKGDVEPGITGQANPASILSRGVRTLASRLLGGDKTRYEVTSPRFRVVP